MIDSIGVSSVNGLSVSSPAAPPGPAPAADTQADQERQARRAALQRQISDVERRKARQTQELETIPDNLDPDTAAALRQQIITHFGELHAQHKAAAADLADLDTAPAQPSDDPALLDLLPIGPFEVTSAPEPVQRAIYDAFGLQINYHRPHTPLRSKPHSPTKPPTP